MNVRLDCFDGPRERGVVLHFLFDAPDGVKHRGMVSAGKSRPDAFEAQRGELFHQIHGDLTRMGDFFRPAALFDELVFGNVEFL